MDRPRVLLPVRLVHLSWTRLLRKGRQRTDAWARDRGRIEAQHPTSREPVKRSVMILSQLNAVCALGPDSDTEREY